MFEKSKFNKKYPLLEQYVYDKKLMKKLINDSNFCSFYNKNKNLLIDFINKLKLIYNEEKTFEIFLDYLENFNAETFLEVSNNLNKFIKYVKEYDNELLEVIRNIDWQKIIQTSYLDIEETAIDLVFNKYYTKSIKIKNIDVSELYNSQSIGIKKCLLELAKNNNLDFFAFVVEELGKYDIKIKNLNDIFNVEINDKLYSEKTRERLGEKNFTRLIVFCFNNAYKGDILVINKLLEADNYDLIVDLLNFDSSYSFSRYVKDEEYDKDIFSLNNIESYDILKIICNYISPEIKLDIEYLNNLHSISVKIYETFYEKHKEALDLLQNLHYEKFKNLSIEQQKKIYKYVKSLDDDEKTLLVRELEKINVELRILYKEEYASKFSQANLILDKAKERNVLDSQGRNHNIKIYELKNEEPFSFLITVMHHQARLYTVNMYNRPPHKLTIDNPENFCKDLNGGSEIISTSMIDQTFIDTFVGALADVMYIFSDIESNDILGICPEDGAYPPIIDKKIDLFSKSKPIGPDELMIMTRLNRNYNEISIKRKREDGTRIMPTAILCYDKINDVSLKHAEYFNIPIVVIKTNTYRNLAGFTNNMDESEYHI